MFSFIVTIIKKFEENKMEYFDLENEISELIELHTEEEY